MNGLRILYKRSLNGRFGHVWPATICHSLGSLYSTTSTNSLFCLTIASDFKADLSLHKKRSFEFHPQM